MSPLLYFVPSFYGDVRFERLDSKRCKMIVDKATLVEQKALTELQTYALKKAWIKTEFMSVSSRLSVELDAPIEKVAKMLAKALKPGRKLVSAVQFRDGKLEEVTEATFADEPAPIVPIRPIDPYREPATVTPVTPVRELPRAAVTVAAPTCGCPAPDFVSAELKARAVLSHFLEPDQEEDFRKYNRFISVGGTTGHRYMITSRHARDELSTYHRTLYDLDDQVPLCVHDWSVPAAEEMLALHLLVQLPGYEEYLRYLES